MVVTVQTAESATSRWCRCNQKTQMRMCEFKARELFSIVHGVCRTNVLLRHTRLYDERPLGVINLRTPLFRRMFGDVQ